MNKLDVRKSQPAVAIAYRKPSFSFKECRSYEDRLAEAVKIRHRNPDCVPVIIEKSSRSPGLPDLKNKKFLVPSSYTVFQLQLVIRRRLKVNAKVSLYLQCDRMVLMSSSCLADVDLKYRDCDGFLYISYCGQETFG